MINNQLKKKFDIKQEAIIFYYINIVIDKNFSLLTTRNNIKYLRNNMSLN